jgi:hypothetical protein
VTLHEESDVNAANVVNAVSAVVDAVAAVVVVVVMAQAVVVLPRMSGFPRLSSEDSSNTVTFSSSKKSTLTRFQSRSPRSLMNSSSKRLCLMKS